MRVTTQGEYGLRCMINIAKNSSHGPVSIQSIANEEHLPRTYVEQLLLKLRRKNLIQSIRGAHGGYLLGRSPDIINMREIIEALEGGIFEVVCERRARSKVKCIYDGSCSLNSVWRDLKKKVSDHLEQTTLEQLVLKESQDSTANSI
jgi:Rrf2 family transcriptional regulator, cysteine metabolism repressor